MAQSTCTLPGCNRPLYARGRCKRDYDRLRRSGDPVIKRRIPPAQRFANLTNRTDPSGCWNFTTKSEDQSGHKRFQVGGKSVTAHRFAYELAYGPIPAGLSVLHHCDNPACVKPDHLYAGTHADNMRDRSQRNRGSWLQGEDNPLAKLDEEVVRAIRTRAADGESQRSIARFFGINQTAVSKIVRRIRWAHVVDVPAYGGLGGTQAAMDAAQARGKALRAAYAAWRGAQAAVGADACGNCGAPLDGTPHQPLNLGVCAIGDPVPLDAAQGQDGGAP